MSYLKPGGSDLERFDGLSLIYWTLMGPHGMDRHMHCFDFYDCANGLGIKVIGGVKEFTGEEYGVYVKRILPGGVAYIDGRLQPGDQILEVNGDSLIGVTNERAVEILRTASGTSYMRLLVTRDDDARKEFSDLLERFGSHSSSGSAQSSPTSHTGSRSVESTSSGSSSCSQSPLLLSPIHSQGMLFGNPGQTHPSVSHCSVGSGIQSVTVKKFSDLGLTVGGGTNRSDGPMVYVHDIQQEGDCSKDGCLQVGDQLIAINKDPLLGATYEEAKRIVAKNLSRHEGNTEVAFVPGRGQLHPGHCANNGAHSLSTRENRWKVHVRFPESRHNSHFPVPSPSPDVCPPECIISAPDSPSRQGSSSTPKPKVPLDPHVRLKDGKLELMLQYLNLDMSEEKKRQLWQRLTTDSQGTVAYGDFLQVLKDLLPEEDTDLHSNSALFSPHEVATLLDTSAFHSPMSESVSSSENEKLDNLQLEMVVLQQEVQRLKSLLKEVESNKKSMEDELQKLNQKASSFLQENQCLQNKLQAAEVFRWRAQSAEQDYEEVIHLLEAEIMELKSQLTGKKNKELLEAESDALELKKHLSLVNEQLHKSEVAQKHLEIYNRKLLLFVQHAHRLLSAPCSLPKKRISSQEDEDKTKDASETTLLSSELARLLIAEGNELLENNSLSSATRDGSITEAEVESQQESKADERGKRLETPICRIQGVKSQCLYCKIGTTAKQMRDPPPQL
ncbi:syntaxin-binding protein 4-like isoform X2 [Crotalus tigris]|uniref:syntaxin-binding protein 4-like isoform X2 n=1 Tax=Crotalus tigris TaxID=88082 RepID=UPI00192F530A|nr:syntaxin-binding protein 4-like isoform X2 [Crotalus tigris]